MHGHCGVRSTPDPHTHTPLLPACLPCVPALALLQKHTWTKGLTLRNFEEHSKANERLVGEIQELASEWP